MFNTPVAIFVFKRKDTLKEIVARIKEVAPKKVYIIADGPRNEEEKKLTDDVRKHLDDLIDWDCEVIKNYSEANRGVYENIGLGAKWVLEREDTAIFLEDDNLPEKSFFRFCEEMLEKYKNDNRVLWVCGTNYLGSYTPPDSASYVYTQHLLPCGWASWKQKYTSYYDGELLNLNDYAIECLRNSYVDKNLFFQDLDVVTKTKRLLETDRSQASWDRQMLFSIRINGLYGVAPSVNLIKNIGVDEHSTHGGTSMKKTMTSRFCEIETLPVTFPLKHPKFLLPDSEYDKKVSKVILYPFLTRFTMRALRKIKPLIGLRIDESLVLKLRKLLKRT